MQLTELALVDGTSAVLAQGCGALEDHVHGLVLSRAGGWTLLTR
jgi:hypothetical protein